ncbi:hypothetical protein [Clostridium sp. UBA1652]|nr:hypothetical protein [Clostridium sp. UBA1652]
MQLTEHYRLINSMSAEIKKIKH